MKDESQMQQEKQRTFKQKTIENLKCLAGKLGLIGYGFWYWVTGKKGGAPE